MGGDMGEEEKGKVEMKEWQFKRLCTSSTDRTNGGAETELILPFLEVNISLM
jgi:hypothetical protein